MTRTSARPGGNRRTSSPGRSGAKPAGKNTGREARSERPSKEDRPKKNDRPFQKERPTPKTKTDRGGNRFSNDKPFLKDRREGTERGSSSERPYSRERRESSENRTPTNRPYAKDRREGTERGSAPERPYSRENNPSRPFKTGATQTRKSDSHKDPFDDSIRLNRYIANAGVCSRREADELIKNGAITVNGQIVTEMGIKVKPGDVIMYGTQKLINEKKVYILLNKPKDYITTTDDPHERKTVTELIRNACRERVYPVGRLDRNTTGLLLLTNDGDLTKKLSHPKHGIKKLYHVHLDQPVTKADLEQIASGVKIDNNLVVPDAVSYIDRAESKKEIGIEIHSGQNRVVRRIFEQLGYKVTKLDRVLYAGLTKKDLPRGKWRFLTEKELSFLKMMG